jgi:hypothetical protein
MEAHKPPSAGLVLGPPRQARQVSEAEVIRADTAPAGVEGGCRWLKAPWCVVSSLLVKQPSRLHGLWMVMTWAWLVDSLTPRRWPQP